jgi:hypothetical protein
MTKSPIKLPAPVFDDPRHHIRLYQGDSLELLALLPESSVDLIFADPPYFLSNGGITCHAGKMVSVNKGAWDKSQGPAANHEFNRSWLAACQRVLKPNGSLWVSGTAHVIHSVGFAMQQLGFKLLNDISWVKPNPPPNLSCRYFTHATETIIWAARDKKSRHTFMKARRGSLSRCINFRRGRERTLQAARGIGRSQRMASSICSGAQPYSSARSFTDSRALKRAAIIAVDIPVPVITGFPNPTKGLISIVLGSFALGFPTNGKNFIAPLGLVSTRSKNIL